MKRIYIFLSLALIAGLSHAGWRDILSGIFAGEVQPPDLSTMIQIEKAEALRSAVGVTIVIDAVITKRMSNPLALALVVQNSDTNPPPYNRRNPLHSTLAEVGYRYRRENDEIYYDYEIPMGSSTNRFSFENLTIPESVDSVMIHLAEVFKRPNHNRGSHNQGPFAYSEPRKCSPVATLIIENE